MHLVCLDLEGVLVPEIWIAVAEKTGRPELRRTTRDEPDYGKLMRGRIAILDQHGLKLADIQAKAQDNQRKAASEAVDAQNEQRQMQAEIADHAADRQSDQQIAAMREQTERMRLASEEARALRGEQAGQATAVK